MSTFLKNSENQSSSDGLTLIDAMLRLCRASQNSYLEPSIYNVDSRIDDELKYLTSRFGMTFDETILFSIICELGSKKKVTLYDIGKHLGLANLEILQYKPVIDRLVERGLVVDQGDINYYVPQMVLQELSYDRVWSDELHVYASDMELYEDIFERFVMASKSQISKVSMHYNVLRLLDTNSNLHFAKVMAEFRDGLDEDEFMFLLSMVCLWLVNGAQTVPFERGVLILRSSENTNKVRASLLNGKSPLLTRGIIRCCTDNSCDSELEYSLTKDTKQKIIPEKLIDKDPLAYLMLDDEDSFKDDEANVFITSMLQPDKIVIRPLFYNISTACQVDELATLLNENKMRSVLRRLKKSGMRCGFTCLFHGAPGTGKTETVLQLARKTGRAVFQVEVSQLRSKWHGESEKLVKQLFDEYRKIVSQSDVAPIMLFNEADAIFNRRMEDAERSIDKSENTLQNIILQEMENLEGILIATTNLANNLDKAFERRFLYKIEFETPDTDTRAKIWNSMMSSLDNTQSLILAEQYPDLAGGHIENISRKATVSRVLHGKRTSWDELTEMCRQELLDSKKHNVIGFRSTNN